MVTRRVRTPEGSRRYGLPIGAPIVADAAPLAAIRTVGGTVAEAARRVAGTVTNGPDAPASGGPDVLGRPPTVVRGRAGAIEAARRHFAHLEVDDDVPDVAVEALADAAERLSAAAPSWAKPSKVRLRVKMHHAQPGVVALCANNPGSRDPEVPAPVKELWLNDRYFPRRDTGDDDLARFKAWWGGTLPMSGSTVRPVESGAGPMRDGMRMVLTHELAHAVVTDWVDVVHSRELASAAENLHDHLGEVSLYAETAAQAARSSVDAPWDEVFAELVTAAVERGQDRDHLAVAEAMRRWHDPAARRRAEATLQRYMGRRSKAWSPTRLAREVLASRVAALETKGEPSPGALWAVADALDQVAELVPSWMGPRRWRLTVASAPTQGPWPVEVAVGPDPDAVELTVDPDPDRFRAALAAGTVEARSEAGPVEDAARAAVTAALARALVDPPLARAAVALAVKDVGLAWAPEAFASRLARAAEVGSGPAVRRVLARLASADLTAAVRSGAAPLPGPEAKLVRRVRTPQGARRYRLPIGAPILDRPGRAGPGGPGSMLRVLERRPLGRTTVTVYDLEGTPLDRYRGKRVRDLLHEDLGNFIQHLSSFIAGLGGGVLGGRTKDVWTGAPTGASFAPRQRGGAPDALEAIVRRWLAERDPDEELDDAALSELVARLVRAVRQR
jgi:hypothetical protein